MKKFICLIITLSFFSCTRLYKRQKTLLEHSLINLDQKLTQIIREQKMALIIIDAQKEYTEGKLKLPNIEKSLKVIQSLRRWAKENNILIVHVQHIAKPGSPLFNPQTKMIDFIPQVTPVEGEKIIQKTYPNSFIKTHLHQVLKENGVKTLILTGYMTHMCIDSTARGALGLGLRTIIIDDATQTRSLTSSQGKTLNANQIKESTLTALRDRFAYITDSNTFMRKYSVKKDLL